MFMLNLSLVSKSFKYQTSILKNAGNGILEGIAINFTVEQCFYVASWSYCTTDLVLLLLLSMVDVHYSGCTF